MKKSNYIFAITIILSLFTSCDLTIEPETSRAPSTYFKTEQDLEFWTNKFYYDLLEGPDGLANVYADDMLGLDLSSIQRGLLTTSAKTWTTPVVDGNGYITKPGTFTPLMNINYFLENSSKCSDKAVRDKYDGVAYFFRAYFYYKMVRQYGDMPWYDYVIASSDVASLNKPRDPRGYVMMKVLEDCDKAYELLPVSWENGPLFHVSKDAAMALKSRAALLEGTFRKYHAGTQFVPNDKETYDGVEISSEWFLKQSIQAAETIIGKKSLYNGNTMNISSKNTEASYREYFVLEDADPSETIMARAYKHDELIDVRHNTQFKYKNGKHSATQRFVNHYLKKDGTAYSKADLKGMKYYDHFQNRDPRLAQTIHGPGYVPINGTAPEKLDWERTISGYRIIKYISDSSHEVASSSTSDFPIFRYAEVLLNYAEAKAELGVLTASDISRTIDVLRNRVGMPPMGSVPTKVDELMAEYYPNAKGEQLAAILEIRRERTIELCFEGFRQWDLLRWKEGVWLTPLSTGGFQGIYIGNLGNHDLDGDGKPDICVYDKTNGKPTTTAPNVIDVSNDSNFSLSKEGHLTYYKNEKYLWNELRDYLWPIPEDQRQITNGALSQNPGW